MFLVYSTPTAQFIRQNQFRNRKEKSNNNIQLGLYDVLPNITVEFPLADHVVSEDHNHL